MTALVRLAMSALRRFTREPESREASSRHLLTAAIHLLAEETSPEQAALTCTEVLGELAVMSRVKRRREVDRGGATA